MKEIFEFIYNLETITILIFASLSLMIIYFICVLHIEIIKKNQLKKFLGIDKKQTKK
jgi:hypothetical protein